VGGKMTMHHNCPVSSDQQQGHHFLTMTLSDNNSWHWHYDQTINVLQVEWGVDVHIKYFQSLDWCIAPPLCAWNGEWWMFNFTTHQIPQYTAVSAAAANTLEKSHNSSTLALLVNQWTKTWTAMISCTKIVVFGLVWNEQTLQIIDVF
jgi:hypothetical protein